MTNQKLARQVLLTVSVVAGISAMAYIYTHRPGQPVQAQQSTADELMRFADARRALLSRDPRCLPRGIDYAAAAGGMGLPPGVTAAEELKRVDEAAVRAGCIAQDSAPVSGRPNVADAHRYD